MAPTCASFPPWAGSPATAVALAAELGLVRNTVQTRMARLETSVALSFERRINPAALGFPLVGFVYVHVQQRLLAGPWSWPGSRRSSRATG